MSPRCPGVQQNEISFSDVDTILEILLAIEWCLLRWLFELLNAQRESERMVKFELSLELAICVAL